MTPHRTGGRERGGMFRFDRVFRGVGRINVSSGTDRVKELQKRDGILTKLFEAGQLEVLRLFRDGDLTIEQLIEADRQKRLRSDALVADLALRQNLWKAAEGVLPRMGKAPATRARYALSLKQLRTVGALKVGKRGRALLPKAAKVADLRTADWAAIRAHWSGGASDWNRMIAAVSRFLSLQLDDKWHPFRREVMKKLERQEESEGRVPDVSVEDFWTIVKRTPEPAQPCYVTLAAAGMRIGEFLSCDASALRPASHVVAYGAGKTGRGEKHVDAELWPFVAAAIPCRVAKPQPAAVLARGIQYDNRYKRLYTWWKKAAKAAGHAGLTIHDLRHLYGQLAGDTMPEQMVQAALEHKTPAMTRKYMRKKVKGEVARAVGRALIGGNPSSTTRKTG